MSVVSALPSFDFAPLSFIPMAPDATGNSLVATILIIKLQILALGEMAQNSKLAKPQARRFGRGSPPPCTRRHVASHIAAAGDLSAGADLDVANAADLAAKGHKISKLGATGNTGLCHDDAMPANNHVVANLHEIINFRAFANDRVP